MPNYILAIDQGTTSSRAIIFNENGTSLGVGQQEFTQHFPENGWVEHDPEEIWQTTLNACKTALKKTGINASDLSCIGITNQRETTVVWDRVSGKPVYNAIVWQDRRTGAYCDELNSQPPQPDLVATIQQKTGLLLDSYFSGTKIRWILNEVPGVRERAERGELAFGTIDSFLLWRLTNGESHCTDATNASRTLLFNIQEHCWDEDLLALFDIPKSLLPEVKDCAADFGSAAADVLGAAIPITGVAGDQQAAAFGQCCFQAGNAKSTYGTGCFLLLNTGEQQLSSNNQLLSTIGYRLDGKTSYAIEGSIFMAGATMQWIRDGLKLIDDAAESEALAEVTDPDLSVYLVPAFTGLGAPYWDSDARGALFGMTRDTGIKEVVTAGLMSVCYQTRDLVEAIAADGASLDSLKVDGGMVSNNFTMQNLSDLLACEVKRPTVTETTALGAAYLAGLQAGIFNSLEEIELQWQLDRKFTPNKSESWRSNQYDGWLNAVQRTRSTST